MGTLQLSAISHLTVRTTWILLLAGGLLLWVINLVYGRPLFLDEANVARNLYDRSFSGLFHPLAHEQYAPPLYLVITKLLAELLDYRETVLRIPAFVGGLIAVFGLYRAGRLLGLGTWGLLPMALLFVNPTVLRYVGEVKPYGLDIGIAACLLAAYISHSNRPWSPWSWLLVGVLAPWLSLPSVFVLAALGFSGLISRPSRWSLPIAGWLVSFVVLYVTVLHASVGSDYLDSFHAAYFFPLPGGNTDYQMVGFIFWGILRLSYGFTWVSLLWGGGLVVVGLLRTRLRYSYLVLPLAFAVGASIFHYYSLIDRLLLFALPGIWLATTLAARKVCRGLNYRVKWPLLVVTLIALGGTNVYRNYFHPLRFSDGRALARLAGDHSYDAHPLAVPVLDYYLRIHPHTRAVTLTVGSATERYRLYDVATAPSVRKVITQDSFAAVQQGCTVTKIELFQACSLQLYCP